MLASSLLKLIFLKIGCCFTTAAPFSVQPSRSPGFFASNCKGMNKKSDTISKFKENNLYLFLLGLLQDEPYCGIKMNWKSKLQHYRSKKMFRRQKKTKQNKKKTVDYPDN